MDWRDIPSLASLRAFEVTARHGTFSAAARELNVTHAAVAQHVRALEDFFSTELMYRAGRGMRLTDAGLRLSGALADGFGEIAEGVRQLKQSASGRPVRVSVTPAFGEKWLMPRLGDFWEKYPDIEVEIKPATRLMDLRHDDIDLAVRYGRGDWPGVEARPLAAARNIVVGSAKLLGKDRPTTAAAMMRYRWVVERYMHEAEFVAETLGFSFDEVEAHLVDTNALAVSAIRSGLGLGFQSAALISRELESGELVALTEPVQDNLGYYLVTLKGRETEQMRKFMRWVLRSAG
ncbi:MAG: LysR substrate-binding domain-containing protein [Pseudomonadota bacterium]